MPLEIGTVLRHRYRIDEVLGQGGMGAVYRAFDINLGVPVAVKENLFTTEEYARQFRREATILASLRHPNLPRVTDHFVIEGEGQYLVMDYIEGEDLRERLERDGPVPESEALPWFLEICDALAYLHSRVPPILHRDIKPGNIKITTDGRAMLVDFGLAKVVDETGTTTTGAKAMTPGFSPPEQYGAGRTDPRTDVYSLGATMYATLTAAIPEDSLERAMGRATLTPVRKRNPKVSPAVARAIERALAVRPEDRFQSVADFAAALAAASDASRPTLIRNYPYLHQTLVSPGRAVPQNTVPTVEAEGRRRRRWPVLALLALVALVVAAAGASYAVPGLNARLAAVLAGPAVAANETATPATPPASPTTAPTATASNLGALAETATPTLSPTETFTPLPPTETPLPAAVPTPLGGGVGQLAFASDRTGIPQVYLINVDGTGLVQLTNLQDGACQPEWSPDGSRLVFISPCRANRETYPGSSLWMINADGTGLEPLPTAPGGDFDPAWSPDGTRIAFTSLRDGRPQVYLLDLETGEAKNLSATSAWESQPTWSPSGTQIIFVSTRSGFSEIWVMPDLGGGAAQRFSRSGGRENTYPHWSADGELVLYEQNIGGVPRLVATRFEDRGAPEFRLCPEGPLAVQPMAEGRWSPDVRWVAFETWPTGNNHDIAIMTVSCTLYTQLTTDPAFDFDPAWRP